MSGLSRKRRILDLALKFDKINSDDCSEISNNVEEISKQESINQRNSNISPLPLAAQNIDVEMAEIWQDVFDDSIQTHASDHQPQDTVDYTQCDWQQVASLSKSVHEPQITHPDEVLTPLNIEVTSSFNNSPAVYIEEFEEPAISTPSSSQYYMVLATPMPSPVNMHTKCDNLFCPDHSEWIYSVQSLNDSPSLSAKLIKKRKGKKREVHMHNWSDVKRKKMKNLGKKYVSKRGKFIDDKMMGKPCRCRYNCADKFTEEQRYQCFNKFWKLGGREKQWSFVVKYVKKTVKNRCLNRDTPNRRQYTFKYFLPFLSDTNATPIQVCKTMFLQTLSVSESIVKTAFKKYDGVADIEEDRRGKHQNHKFVVDNKMIKSVCDYINSFVPVESHFIRKDSTKLYLDGSLSISRIYKMYNEWYDDTVYESKVKTERQYRDIVNKNFNLAFHIPKKDQCEVCHVYCNTPEPTNNHKSNYEEHINAKKIARNLKQKDKQDALESQGSIVTAVFDFQKVLSCPHGQISIFYYKRKLSALNFTVFNMAMKKAVCYMWDETIAKRGANEVASCLLDYISDYVEQGAKEFRFWSDNCAGQNRNRFVFYLYLYAAKKYKVSILHRFLEKGHTQNEGDSVHALIERSSHSKTIYTPYEWRLLVRWAKTEGEPYLVKNMTQENFFDFKAHVNDKLWTKNYRQQKILWTKIKEVFVDKSEPNKLYYKYNLNDETYECLSIRTDTRNSAVVPVLQHAYSSPIKLTNSKYKDIISMCDSGVINSNNAIFFRSLPHNSADNDDRHDLSDEE